MKPHSVAAYPIFYLLIISAVVRALMAAVLSLGNDEAYYYTYALYPALSHFDHPPMVGWVIQLFSLNLHFSSEIFIRMAAVVAGTVNTWLMYCIGKQLSDERTGWYAALLYTATIYGFVIVGVFILPDSPQSVFWLSAIFFLLKAFGREMDVKAKRWFFLASVFIGLALLSKYTTAYLWLGMIIYILVYNRKWLATKVFYWAHLVIGLLFLPVIIWNAQNGFVSFLFHSGRVEPVIASLRLDYFFPEILGEALYINPVVFVLVLIAVVAFFTGKFNDQKPQVSLLIWSAVPLICTFMFISLFRRTLPHWNSAGYMTLLPLTALWLRNRSEVVWPALLKDALVFILFLITFATVQIFTGFIPFEKFVKEKEGKGTSDYSLEMYGWRQLWTKFTPLAAKYEKEGAMPLNAPIVSYRWFPAANYSYYAARGTGHYVLAAGDTSDIHKFVWINQMYGGFKLNSDAWYITSSRNIKDPKSMSAVTYEKIMPPDTISVIRMGKTAYYFYVYRLKKLLSKQ